MVDLKKIFTDPKQKELLSISDILKLQNDHPYCLNLQYILLEKSAELGEDHFNAIIKKVSAYSIDRQHLKEKILAIRANLNNDSENKKKALESPEPAEVLEERVKRAIVTQKVRILERPKRVIESKQIDQSAVEAIKKTESNKQELEIVKKEKADKSKVSFDEWLGSLKTSIKLKEQEILQESPKSTKKKEKKKGKKKKKKKLAMLLAKNKDLIEQDIATETLADILAKQGYKDKAKKMYKKLILLFPEKSAYFADKIKELKKIDNV